MASSSSATDLKTPRRILPRVIVEKYPSTALSQEADVGVKWKVHRGCAASHFKTFGMFVRGVIVDDVVNDLAAWRSTELRNRMNSLCRCLFMQRPITVPSRMFRAA